MPEYDNRNTFTLFKNDKKQKDTDCDYSGTFVDGGNNEYYINGWSKTSNKTGSKFIAGNMKPKAATRAAAERKPVLEDGIPF